MEETIKRLKEWAENSKWALVSETDGGFAWLFGKTKKLQFIDKGGSIKSYTVYKSGYVNVSVPLINTESRQYRQSS